MKTHNTVLMETVETNKFCMMQLTNALKKAEKSDNNFK